MTKKIYIQLETKLVLLQRLMSEFIHYLCMHQIYLYKYFLHKIISCFSRCIYSASCSPLTRNLEHVINDWLDTSGFSKLCANSFALLY